MALKFDDDRTSAGTSERAGRRFPTGEEAFFHLWTCSGTSGACALNTDLPVQLYVFRAGTNGGASSPVSERPFQSALSEIRQRSQLTWSQLAKIFGVNRRSLHFWARGASPSPENAERIASVLQVIRTVYVGDPARTHRQLLEPRWDGLSVVDLLAQGEDAKILQLVSPHESRPTSRTKRPPALSSSERQRRSGFEPVELLDSLHDSPPVLGKPLGAVSIPGLRV